MAQNTFKEKRTEEKKSTTRSSGNGFLQSLLNGSFLTFDKSPGLLPFLLFLTVLSVLFIANTYYAEKKIRQIESVRREVVELRTVYISNKAELMYLTNQSEIARRVADQGIVESTVPPRIIKEKEERRSFLLRIFYSNRGR